MLIIICSVHRSSDALQLSTPHAPPDPCHDKYVAYLTRMNRGRAGSIRSTSNAPPVTQRLVRQFIAYRSTGAPLHSNYLRMPEPYQPPFLFHQVLHKHGVSRCPPDRGNVIGWRHGGSPRSSPSFCQFVTLHILRRVGGARAYSKLN